MSKPPRAQELNAPILRLARDIGALADKELHGHLAREFGAQDMRQAIGSVEQMLFSATVNLAKRRLVRYGLLKLDATKHISITAQGELFLARGFTRLDSRTRRFLDDAWRELASPAEPALGPGGDDGSRLRARLEESDLEYHEAGAGAVVAVWSRLRSWNVELRETNGWICLRSHVMSIPAAPAARLALIDAAMRSNTELTVWRFVVDAQSRALFLEAEYGAAHLDGESLAELVSILRDRGDAEYEKLVKVALAPAPLDALEEAFKRSA